MLLVALLKGEVTTESASEKTVLVPEEWEAKQIIHRSIPMANISGICKSFFLCGIFNLFTSFERVLLKFKKYNLLFSHYIL